MEQPGGTEQGLEGTSLKQPEAGGKTCLQTDLLRQEEKRAEGI